MPIRCVGPIFVFAVVGCGAGVRFGSASFHGGGAWRTESAGVALLLLGAKEGTDIGEMDAPAPAVGEKVDGKGAPREAREGGFVLKAGGGIALPGTGAIGSAHGSAPEIPAYSDVWTEGTAFDITGEFGAGKKIRPYAQASFTQFAGQKWTNPADPADTWMLSESSLALLAGGVRFGGNVYGKVAAGLWLWPEVSRVDYFDGYTEPIFESGLSVALGVGGGAEFHMGKLKAYVDAEFLLVTTAPAKGENAVVFWPEFEPAGMNSFKLAGGVGISF